MSAEQPKPGDVWLHEETGEPVVVYEHAEGGQYGSSTIAESVFLFQRAGVEAGLRWSVPVSGLREKGRFLGFNIFDLLSGDPSAWAAALRFAPEVFLLAVGEGEERRDVLALPKSHELVYLAMDDWRTGESLTAKVLGGRWWVEGSANGMTGIEECAGDFPTAVNAALKGEGDA